MGLFYETIVVDARGFSLSGCFLSGLTFHGLI